MTSTHCGPVASAGAGALRSVHVTVAHLPYDVRIFAKECRTLAQAGYDVVLIAPEATTESSPAAAGSGRDRGTAEDRSARGQGVELRLMPQSRSRVERLLVLPLRALVTALAARGDVYHLHDPQLLGVGFVLKLLGRRVVYDAHEDTPRQALGRTRWSPARRRMTSLWATWLERVAGRTFDGIVAATPVIARRYPASRTVLVQNFPRSGELRVDTSVPHAARPAHVAYVGAIADVRGVREMIRAVATLPAEAAPRLVLAGTFRPPELVAECSTQAGWDRVVALGQQTRPEVAALLGRVRAGLVLLHPTPSYVCSQPTKLYEYMAAGLPVIASDFPTLRAVIEPAGCGYLVDPFDVNAVAAALRRILEHPAEAEAMGRRGAAYVREHLRWESEGERLLDLYARFAR